MNCAKEKPREYDPRGQKILSLSKAIRSKVSVVALPFRFPKVSFTNAWPNRQPCPSVLLSLFLLI